MTSLVTFLFITPIVVLLWAATGATIYILYKIVTEGPN